MRALYLAVVIMMLLATAMNVEGTKKYKPSCYEDGGRCAKLCYKYEDAYYGYDCSLCCKKSKKDD